MRNLRAKSGPFAERPFFTDGEVERTCEDALRLSGYFPTTPGPVKIDRFIEKHFKISPQYDDLPEGVLGYSCFGQSGMVSMHIAAALTDSGKRSVERRVNTTLAHEAGHGLFHAHLFALAEPGLSLFERDPDITATKILCRDENSAGRASQGYDGRWWEHQAHKAIGPLLLPKSLVIDAVAPFLTVRGLLGVADIAPDRREEAVRHVGEIFDVNAVVARIRLQDICKPSGAQLTL
ncbi:MAG: hypothetical protein ABI718_12915 [Acidobacteriota bacterium]